MRNLSAIALLALLLTAFNPPSAKAQCFNACVIPPPPPPRAVPVVGPWVVGVFGLSTLSVIIRAAVVSHHLHRELTSKEAADAIFIPFIWILIAESTGAARGDLKTIMDGVKAINKEKEGFRTVNNPVNVMRAGAQQPRPDQTIKHPRPH